MGLELFGKFYQEEGGQKHSLGGLPPDSLIDYVALSVVSQMKRPVNL